MRFVARVYLSAILLSAGAPLLVVPTAAAQDTGTAKEVPATDAENKVLNEILNRLSRVEQELDEFRRKGMPHAADKSQRHIVGLLDTLQLGASFHGSGGGRYFVGRLVLVNLTTEAVTLKREHVTLTADGQSFELKDIPPAYQNYSLPVGNQNLPLRDLQPAKLLAVPAGGTASMWIFFGDLPKGSHVPVMVLKLNFGERTEQLDVNATAAQLLGLSVERIGPHQSLALLTISGTMNTVNLGALVETLDALSAQKVARCVIRWTDSAAPLDNRLRGWLYQEAAGATSRSQNEQFPVLPATIRELHLAQMPTDGSSRPGPPGGPNRIHEHDVDAVDAALESAYEILPRDELLREIRFGHRLARAAALAHGGGRLSSDMLPIILNYADADDPLIQKGALTALRHFGEDAAIDKLLHYARKNSDPLAETAVESLAASRFAVAHDALLKLLENEDAKSKVSIVRILARHPRPIWSETIYSYCQDPRFGLNVAALRALVQVGHPKLIGLLEEALNSGDRTLREEAFGQLALRTDAQSEAIAMDYTLSELEQAPPTPQMYKLLDRTKDQRAIPLLLSQLQAASNRTQLINLLEKIGDQSVSEVLAEQYPNFGTPEKAATLNALFRLNSPRFRELAAHALLSNESALVGAACQGLQKQGDPDAVRLLADALEKSSASSAWSYICNTLATLATPDSQAALRKARDDGDQSKSRYALNALQSLRQRSPGMQYVYQARSFEQQKQFKEALEQYDVAIKIDSELPEAFSGRGNVFLLQNKRDQARPDFERALELDPYSSIAVTGLAIVMVLDGKRDEAIAQVEQARGKVGNDALFAYNAACVYARALESLEHDEQVDNREQKIEEYRDKALSELKRSVQGGFRDYEWMRNDPDLKSLRTTPEFKNIHSPGKSGDATSDDAPQLGDNDEAVNGDIPLPQFVFPRAIQGGF